MIYFSFGSMEKKNESHIDKINKMHAAIKFTTDWSKTSINFIDVTVACGRRYNRDWSIG